ncbi:sugar phosphate isomerase/epimerase [Kaistia dalseonensis]|uniref:D-psicose/D-tagatose/L-ribulose 3-epimerase n=1 Tax=Kaistia dalseonensis TaxID=410840 RepID=A0ABU0H8G1_9HYPH|nr:sugar phosphate isomerase/epimerase [Kaistia dalseonensis]MCX5496004.1 sugar phosphate isomerase/epimerase [Kaistia dalseonensis]MDQ0438607.1 D-psicose/D-tagatose/L-ribulose 3-epimerase [Kaistia dalseonensis]
MKLGFNLLLWTTYVTEDHLPIFDRLKAAGYDGVEIPVFEGTVAHYQKLGRYLEDAGLDCTTVMVMPGGGKNAISADPAERRGALDHINWATDCSEALGAEVLCGPFHQPLGLFSGHGPTEAEKADCAEVHKAAARYAAKADLKLSIEPLNRFECYFLNTARAAKALVEAVDEPNYGYLYDTFHFNIEEKSQPKAIHATASAINHVHISENDRGTPGTGPIDFGSVFWALKAAGYDGWMTVEAFGSALPDLAAATRVWRPLFDKPADVYQGAIKLMRKGWAAA